MQSKFQRPFYILHSKFYIEAERRQKIINKVKFLKGAINNKDLISPAYINTVNPRYIEIDNIFYSGIIITNYYREYDDLILKKIIDTNINMKLIVL